MTNFPWTGIEQFRDIESVNHHAAAVAAGQPAAEVLEALRAKSRDNARTPMQWDGSPGAGFSTGTPWLPVNPNAARVNAAAQVGDPDSVFEHYRRLIALRHDEPAVAHGDFTMLLPDDPRVYAFTRRLDAVELLVLCNVSADPAPVDLPGWDGARHLIGTGGTTDLGPWESRVLRREVSA